MTMQDQLTKSERLRLECFSQAINSSFTIRAQGNRPSLEEIFENARLIEAFIKYSSSK